MPGGVTFKNNEQTKSNKEIEKRKPLASSGQGNAPLNNAAWETQLLQVYGGNAYIKYPHIKPGGIALQSTLEPSSLSLQEGVTVTPDIAQVSAYGDGKDGASSGVIFTALGGRVEFAVSNFQKVKKVEAQLATMNIVADNNSELNQISLPPMDLANMEQRAMKAESSVQAGETEISAYLRDVVIEPVTGISIVLSQGEYIKRKNTPNPQVRFWRTKLVFGKKAITEDFATELDQNELHTSQGQDDELTELKVNNAEAMQVMEILNARMGQAEPEAAIEEVQPQEEQPAQVQQPEVQQPEVQQAKTQPQEEQPQEKTVEKPKEFKPGDVTEDEFVKLEEAEFDPKKEGDDSVQQHGKGKFSFQEIPYTIPIPGHKEIKGTTKVKEPGEKMQEFDINSSGQLQVTFEEPVVLDLIGNEKVAQYLVTTISLINATVNKNYLTAEKIRIDLGVAEKEDDDDKEESESDSEEVEDDETAKKLFGENIHGTIAYIGAVNKIDENGILASPGKKSLGQFGVSKFLGFLNAKGDYPYGSLEVGFDKNVEKDAKPTDIFSEAVKNITDNGLTIPIFGPLAFEFSISPSVKIGGAFYASVKRGKSFGDKMQPGESMQLQGNLGVEGKGELDMAAGLALTVPGLSAIASADIKVETELSAGITAQTTADTMIGMREGKLKQTDKLNLEGEVDMKLKGEGSLSSNVKFLIWKAQLFSIELFKKEVSLLKFKGQASRRPNTEGITNGWEFEAMELSAGKFGKKAFAALRNSEGTQQTPQEELKMSKEAVDSLGPDFKDAWVILEELKRQEKLAEDRAYVMTEADKNALQARIAKMTEEVKIKLDAYQRALMDYSDKLSSDQGRLKTDVDVAQKAYLLYVQKDDVRKNAMRNIERGGFKPENYRPLTSKDHPDMEDKAIEEENDRRKKMAPIDFTIARVLGIYNNAVDFRKADYDIFAQEENLKIQDEKRRGIQNVKPEYTLSKDMKDTDFLSKEFGEWGFAKNILVADTKFGIKREQNYFDILQGILIRDNKIPEGCQALFRRKIKGKVVECTGIRIHDYLQALVSGVYPEDCCAEDHSSLGGKKIAGLTAKYKKTFYEKLFKDKLGKEEGEIDFINRLLDGKRYVPKLTDRAAAMADTNKVCQALFNSNLDDMTAKGNVDIETELQRLDVNVRTSRENYQDILKQKNEVDNAIKEVEKELAACREKFEMLKGNVAQGTDLRANPASVVNAAKGAVNMIQAEYQDIASGTTLLSTSVSSVGTDSAVYNKMKEIGAEKLSGAVIDPKKAKKMQASVTG